MMFGAYVTFWLFRAFGLNPLLAPLVVVPLFFLGGMALQGSLVQRVMKAPPISSLLLLFGVWLILQNVAYLIWTGDTRSILIPYTYASVQVGGTSISVIRSIVFLVAVLSLFLLQQFLTRTYVGKAIRAIAQDSEATKLVGVNVGRISMIAFGLGTALAALAGSLMSLLYAFNPDFGRTHLLKSFCIIVLGGLESFVGVAMGALLLAVAEAWSVMVMKPALQDLISFVLLVVVLVVMPGGLARLIRRQ
jgi:branched-chain amino acid transport system permease protein